MSEQQNKIILSAIDMQGREKTADTLFSSDSRTDGALEFDPILRGPRKPTDGLITVDGENKSDSLYIEGMTFGLKEEEYVRTADPVAEHPVESADTGILSDTDGGKFDEDILESYPRRRRRRTKEERVLEADEMEKFATLPEHGHLFGDGEADDPMLCELYPECEDAAAFYGKRQGRAERAEMKDISVYTKRELKALVKEKCEADISYIRESYEYRLSELRLEYVGAKLRFDQHKRKRSKERSASELQTELKRTEREMRRELRRERKYNKRVFAPILTDYTSARLPASSDRKELMKLRSELFSRLLERDSLNAELVSLYSGLDSHGRGHSDRRFIAEIKGKKRAHKKQKRVDGLIYKYHFATKESKRLYTLMDEYVELSGRMSRVCYSLKHERPMRSVRKSLKRERRRLRRRLSRLDDHIDYCKRRAIERSKDRRSARILTAVGWISFAVLAVFGLIVWANWDTLIKVLGI